MCYFSKSAGITRKRRDPELFNLVCEQWRNRQGIKKKTRKLVKTKNRKTLAFSKILEQWGRHGIEKGKRILFYFMNPHTSALRKE